MSAKIITDITREKPDVNARVYDLYVDGTIHGDITPGTITPGANNTFLRTSAIGNVVWDPFLLSYIPHGTTGQMIVSNGSSASWTSNPTIAGTLGVTGASTFTGNGLFQNDLQVTNDFNVINGDLTVANGKLDVLVGNTTLQQLEVAGQLTFDGSAGLTGYIPVQTGTGPQWQAVTASMIPAGSNNQALFTRSGNVQFANILPSDISTGSANQLLVRDSGNTTSTWTSNPSIPGTLAVAGVLTANGALNATSTMTVTGTGTFNGGTDIAGNLQIAGANGVTGNFLKKTSTSTQSWSNLAATDIKGGTNNQLLISDGTNATFTSNPSIPGTLTVGQTGTFSSSASIAGNLVMSGNNAIFQMSGTAPVALLNETRIYGQLKFSNVAGTTGMVPVTNGGGIPLWSFPQYFSVWYQNSPVQDMNGSGTVSLMTNASVDLANANITYLAGVWTVAEAGQYACRFQTDPTTVGVGAQTRIHFKVNGLYAGSVISTVSTSPTSITLLKTYKLLAGATIEVVSQPVVAGVINTSGSDPQGVATTTLCIQRVGPYF